MIQLIVLKKMLFSSTNVSLLVRSGSFSFFCKITYQGKPAEGGFEFKNNCFSHGIWIEGKFVNGKKCYLNGTLEKGFFNNNQLYKGERKNRNIIEKGTFSNGKFIKGYNYFPNGTVFKGSHNITTNERKGKFWGPNKILIYDGRWYIKDKIKYFSGIEYCHKGCHKSKVLIEYDQVDNAKYLSKMGLRKRKRKN